MAQIELEELAVILQHVRFLDKKNREDTKTSLMELKFTCRVSGDFLANFHPRLRSAFYMVDDTEQEGISDGVPTKRIFGDHIRSFRWAEKLEGAYVELDHGISSKLEVELATVGPFDVVVMEGGTSQITFVVRSEFSSEEVKALSELIKAEMKISAAMAQGDLLEEK